MDLPQAAWGGLWYLLPGKGRVWKERKIRLVHSGQARVLSQLSIFSVWLGNVFCAWGDVGSVQKTE